jgi:hypothetical protein
LLPPSSDGLHGATTQKTAIFILTAVRTSNPTKVTLEIHRTIRYIVNEIMNVPLFLCYPCHLSPALLLIIKAAVVSMAGTSRINPYHTGIGNVNPCTVGLLAKV